MEGATFWRVKDALEQIFTKFILKLQVTNRDNSAYRQVLPFNSKRVNCFLQKLLWWIQMIAEKERHYKVQKKPTFCTTKPKCWNQTDWTPFFWESAAWVSPCLQSGLSEFCLVPFGATCLSSALFVGFFLPETKGKSLSAITREFQKLNFRDGGFQPQHQSQSYRGKECLSTAL